MSGKVGTKTKVYFLHSYLIFVRKAVIREYTYLLMTLILYSTTFRSWLRFIFTHFLVNIISSYY